VADAFPAEREEVEQTIVDAGLSRMYGGLHYRFDVEAGLAIGSPRRRSRWLVGSTSAPRQHFVHGSTARRR
jgi:hypothetical protein